MALRRTCLYNDRIIGIESIYTVVDGKQINIEHKVERLRKLGRENKLFCPCGCGRNLIVVAGQKMLREQHFRIVNDEEKPACEYNDRTDETDESINTKIVLKCWLDEQLKDPDLEARVPVSADGGTERKYEYTFLSAKHHLGVVYTRNIVNLQPEKIRILQQYGNGRKTLYFTSIHCFDLNGQYPENFISLMEHQGFCTGLLCKDYDYAKAKLRAVLFFKNHRNIWDEITLCEDYLSNYSLNKNNELCLSGIPVSVYREQALETCRENDAKEQEEEAKRQKLALLEEQQRRLKEEQRKQQEQEEARNNTSVSEEEIRKHIQEIRRKAALERKQSAQTEENYQDVSAERESKAWNRLLEESDGPRNTRSYGGKNTIITDLPRPEDFKDPGTSVISKSGQKLLLCTACQRILPAFMFSRIDYIPGTKERSNRGLCQECETTVCPDCGRKLVKRNGKYGQFYGCSGYPDCRYTRRI